MDDSQAPQRLGRYEIRSTLGRGGMGCVYLAHDPLLQREVAIKLLTTRDDSLMKRFRREAQALARVTHSAIVTIHDFGDEANATFFVMEKVPGQSLDRILKTEGARSEQATLSIAMQAAAGIAMAHEAGVIHRDLKPSNIVIEPSGRIRVVDFGIARLAGGAALTSQDQLIGTPGYMAPEQALNRTVDMRVDIFALGLTMFAALAGHDPFRGKDRLRVIRQAATQPVPDLREVRPGVNEQLVQLIERMSSLDVDSRPSSMNEVSALLAALPIGPELAPRTPLSVASGREVVTSPATPLSPTVAVRGSAEDGQIP